MAKARKLIINWNGLTVGDIQEIIDHFADAEQHYTQYTREAHAAQRPAYFASSIPIVQERQVFWKQMQARVAQGEKIASRVREYRATGQF